MKPLCCFQLPGTLWHSITSQKNLYLFCNSWHHVHFKYHPCRLTNNRHTQPLFYTLHVFLKKWQIKKAYQTWYSH